MASAYWLNSGILVLSTLSLFSILLQVTSECDRKFVSHPGGPQNGTFSAPTFINPAGHSRHCVYTFVAQEKQRVQIIFTTFNLRGTPPDGSISGVLPACNHEYMDVYAEVQTQNTSELVNTPFGGRFCGPIPPRRRISLYNVLSLGFYSDKNSSYPELFGGTFSFINGSEYEVGTPAPDSTCTFTVHSSSRKTGTIVSPTYPGSYPKDLFCSYLFRGKENQRVRIEFRDFDLFFGGPHCPYDFVKLYDGEGNDSAVIGTYCGQQRNLVLYSSESSLLVTFQTLARTANTQNRGFKGIFEFSESFVKLDFIRRNDGEHIRGSECDQKILSKENPKQGYVFSPNYPYPYHPKVVCRYFIYGMQDSQHLERVKLEFHKFNIPKGEKGDCTDGYLKLYLKGQEATDSYDKFDYEMCGDEFNGTKVASNGPRLVMVFSSGELQGQGFKAKYSFETDYRIFGTAAPDGTCSFTYRSTSVKRGEFNSPRYPSNYPSGLNCTYLFLPTPNEQVTLVFEHFRVRADAANSTAGNYGAQYCQEDWLEIYSLYRDNTATLIGRYCGMTTPGPIESNRAVAGVKVILHTNSEGVYSGFKARYIFEDVKSVFGDCGNNISSLEYGVISSPNFPVKNYDGPARGLASQTCIWYINVRQKHKILLNFDAFAVEGEPSVRGCPAAVVRLWYTEGPPLELCGEMKPTEKWQYLSDSNTMRISFVSSDKSVGAKGFKAVWTEVSDSSNCDEFTCKKSSFCIAEKLRCNSVDNCGANDQSDEINCLVDTPMSSVTVVSVTVSVVCVLIAVLCIWCHFHKKRRRRIRRMSRLRRNTPTSSRRVPGSTAGSCRTHVCDELGERFASIDSV